MSNSEIPGAILETERLRLRKMTPADAPFILELLNEESFISNIGDKGVRDEAGAVGYIQTGPLASYERFGFGLYLVELKSTGEPIGICGLLKRDNLEHADVGFAFLPRFWRKGYAAESAAAVIDFGKNNFGLKRIAAITNPDNIGSIKVLERVGLRFERMIRLSDDSPEIKLFVSEE